MKYSFRVIKVIRIIRLLGLLGILFVISDLNESNKRMPPRALRDEARVLFLGEATCRSVGSSLKVACECMHYELTYLGRSKNPDISKTLKTSTSRVLGAPVRIPAAEEI